MAYRVASSQLKISVCVIHVVCDLVSPLSALYLLIHIMYTLFVRDGIHSVADYNSTLMCVVVVVVVRIFHDGITRERLELSSGFFAW